MTDLKSDTCQKMYCNTCKVETHHELKAAHSRCYQQVEGEDTPLPSLVFEEEYQYRFWICRGCDTATLEEAYTNIGMVDHDDNEIWESTLHPKRARRDWPLKRFRQLDAKLASIYREVIESFNAELSILCAVGLRALLEGVCADKAVTGNNLQTKIDKLVAYLPSNIVESLHSFRFMGNEAAHELQAPNRGELQLAIEVMEDLLNFLYELDYKARRLSKKWSVDS